MSKPDVQKLVLSEEFNQFERYLKLSRRLFSEEMNKLEDKEEEALKSLDLSGNENIILAHFDDQILEIAIAYQNYLLQGFVFTWYALIEKTLLEYCEKLEIKIDVGPRDKKNLGKGIGRARTFLQVGQGYSIESKDWNELTMIGKLRNDLIHKGDRIKLSSFVNEGKSVLVKVSGKNVNVPLEKNYYKYLNKHELLEISHAWLDFRISFEYCEHLIAFGKNFLLQVHEDLFSK